MLKDIGPIYGALDRIDRLNPVSYKLKSTGRPGMGVLAADVEKVFPELVSTVPDGDKAVNYDGLTTSLISAVQELQKENAALRKRIDDQAIAQQELEDEVRALEPARTVADRVQNDSTQRNVQLLSGNVVTQQ